MKQTPLHLLNRILSASQPDATVYLPVYQAKQLAELDDRELGKPLKTSMRKISIAKALEIHGLFSRRIRVVNSEGDFSVIC